MTEYHNSKNIGSSATAILIDYATQADDLMAVTNIYDRIKLYQLFAEIMDELNA